MKSLLNKNINENNHIIQLIDYQRILSFDNNVIYEFIYNLYEQNLSYIISENHQLGFNISIIKKIAKQLSIALNCLNKNNIPVYFFNKIIKCKLIFKFNKNKCNIKVINLNTDNIKISKYTFETISKYKDLPINAIYEKEVIKNDKNGNILFEQKSEDKNLIKNKSKELNEEIKYINLTDIDIQINCNLRLYNDYFLDNEYILSNLSPELLLHCSDSYDKNDIWALEYVLLELYTGHIIFQSSSLHEHLSKIEKLCDHFSTLMYKELKNENKDNFKIFEKCTKIGHDDYVINIKKCGDEYNKVKNPCKIHQKLMK